MNNHPLPETNPSTTHLQRKERTMTPTLHARKGVLQNGTSGISDRGGYAADETACAITGRGGEHDAGREPGIEQLAFRESRGQHPTQPIHDGGIRDITEQTIGDGHTVRQPGQARPPREHRFVMAARTVTIGEAWRRRGIDAPCRNPDIRSTVMRRRRRTGTKPAVLSSIMPADRLCLETISVLPIHMRPA